jgi:hypothetical protein
MCREIARWDARISAVDAWLTVGVTADPARSEKCSNLIIATFKALMPLATP